MKHIARSIVSCAALWGLLFAHASNATDLATRPLKADILVKPNVIFGMDDSGSMDWEILIDTSSGIAWWNTSTKSAWNSATGVPYTYGTNRTWGLNYLFPNGQVTGGMQYTPNSGNGHIVPPSPQFAAARSSAFNPLYYDPDTAYQPWPDAYHNGSLRTYGQASPTAAKSHPAITGSATMDLTASQSFEINYQVYMLRPDGTQPNSTATIDTTYFPATYWVLESCTAASPVVWTSDCVAAPGGGTLKRHEIKATNYATTAEYNAAIDNFANWWSYYRKRKLMLAGSMGKVMDEVEGLRLGVVPFNRRNAPTMYDSDATSAAENRRRVAGIFYTNPADSGTPTKATLNYIGEQFRTNSSIIQYSCQRNNAFMVTDGFANSSSGVSVPSYSAASEDGSFPHAPTASGSMADMALAYFRLNLRNGRTDLVDGKVKKVGTDTPNPDNNTNLHMNTYAMTLGAKGSVWTGTNDPWTDTFTWPTPQDDDPTSIDDLWHATINGRGQMYRATKPVETANSIQKGLREMLKKGSQSAIGLSTVNLARSNGFAYRATYNPQGWGGDLTANAINKSTGEVSETAAWSAAEKLATQDYTTREIFSHNGTAAVQFDVAGVGALVNPGNVYGDSNDVMNYLRGNRSKEGGDTGFRTRTSLIGAVINSRPAISAEDSVAYVASSEGMLHAFNTNNGNELWAYVPYQGLSKIGASTRSNWGFETLLDGTPVLAKVGSTKLLVGGRGAAGPGYYALDVTSPATMATTKVKWEFGPSATVKMGASVGQPVVVKTQTYGSVVLLSSGYNGTVNDGRGRLFVLNPLTGAVHTQILTPACAGCTHNPGLTHLSPALEADGNVRYVYAGDEDGNLWRFDIESGTAISLAQFTDDTNAKQPITSAPELVQAGDKRIVLVGTGRLLGMSDFGSTKQQSFYAIKDTGTKITNPRSALVPRTLTAVVNGKRDLTGAAVNWETDSGWYFNLPSGEQQNTKPTVVYGAIVFTTNVAKANDCTSASYLYAVDIRTGLKVKAADHVSEKVADDINSGAVITKTDGNDVDDDGDGGSSEDACRKAGGLIANIGLGDGSIVQMPPPVCPGVTSRKNAWRQVQR